MHLYKQNIELNKHYDIITFDGQTFQFLNTVYIYLFEMMFSM